MTQRKRNPNARSPWEAKQAEIARLKAEIERLSAQPLIKAFAEELCESVGTMLAVTEFDQWPEMAKTAYRHCARRNEAGAWFYMERHKERTRSR